MTAPSLVTEVQLTVIVSIYMIAASDVIGKLNVVLDDWQRPQFRVQ